MSWRGFPGGATRLTTTRRARPADAGALAELGARTFQDTFAADNTPDDMALYLASSYGPELQAAELADPGILTLVAEVDGHLAGFAQLRDGPPPPGVGPGRPLELWRFYVERTWQGRGVAQVLMRATLAAAVKRGAGLIWLCVWERNHRAQAFYRKIGFEDCGSKEFVLGRDRQTDRVMARPLSIA